MKHISLLLLLLFYPFFSNAQNHVNISSADVSFVFINHNNEGGLSGFSSSSTIDLDNLEHSKFKGSIDAATINTGNSIRNWSLRRSKYFDVETYPLISFESDAIEIDGDTIKVNGLLTIKDITRKLDFNFTKNGNRLVGIAELYSSDYGVHVKSERKKNKVAIKIVLHLNKYTYIRFLLKHDQSDKMIATFALINIFYVDLDCFYCLYSSLFSLRSWRF